MKNIKFEVPVYYQFSKQLRPTLIGMNWYRNALFWETNNVKKYYHELVYSIVKQNRSPILDGKYEVYYKYYLKRKTTDLMNVGSIIDKFVQDALIESKLIKDDSTPYYRNANFTVGEVDRDNPRMLVELRPCLD
ncbi:hypothetical protein [Francisella sp. SYW-9]|uniref:hypothetical protein n=1 Tax=Francisella sp. SYW-9 TaxID=2610888 RepID=UPI00123E2659|nr:hypothetical protein [Francisella sp. SYW-9]